MKQLVELCTEGAKILDICIEGDKLIEQGTGAVFNKSVKGVKVSKGASLCQAILFVADCIARCEQAWRSRPACPCTTSLGIFHRSRESPLCAYISAAPAMPFSDMGAART